MGRLSTHVLDIANGRPAKGVAIELIRFAAGGAETVAAATTNADGRTDRPLLRDESFATGAYELRFHVGAYFATAAQHAASPPFLDVVPVRFNISEANGDYHVPLLVSPWSYSTYRGS